MKRRFWPLMGFLSSTVLVALPSDALALARHKQARQTHHANKADTRTASRHQAKSAHKGRKDQTRVAATPHRSSPPVKEPAQEPAVPPLSGDLAAVKNAIDLVRKGKLEDAAAIEQTVGDPVAQKLVEWFVLRSPDVDVNFYRYGGFITTNPRWPGIGTIRRRAEARLWQDRADAATVRGFVGDQPMTAKGRLALARGLLSEGDSEGAAREVRKVWASDELSERTEGDAFALFQSLLRSEDHRARMDRRIGAKDFSGATRAAHHLGSDELAIVKACIAVSGGEKKAAGLLDDVSAQARQDLGYVLCQANWLMHQNRIADAARLVIEAPQTTMASQDTDEWWRARRLLARKLLDLSQFRTAYQIASGAAPPANENYRAEFHFLSGWIALRYLNDPKTARSHFDHIDEGSVDPIVLARANYWRARAAEAMGDSAGMWTSYDAAARYTTAYYGQLARAKLGIDDMKLRTPPPAHGAALTEELVHAADMLYAIGERDLVVSFVASLAEESSDAATLAALGELAGRHDDARAMLEIGKTALSRGLALDLYAFPTIGIPQHSPIAPDIGRSMTYAVARTESAFNQRDRSSANAVGLMQVTPEAGRDTAKRFGVTYDWDRMVNDPVYNTQMGAAELSALRSEYKGCNIMIFAGYNAGRGRVREWVKQFGDPRDPNVDPVDWVERIPLAETRNYVQRVIENLAVYRLRFESGGQAVSKLDQGDGKTQAGSPAPAQASALH